MWPLPSPSRPIVSDGHTKGRLAVLASSAAAPLFQLILLKLVTPKACLSASDMVLSSRNGRQIPPQPMQAAVLLFPSLSSEAHSATPAGNCLFALWKF